MADPGGPPVAIASVERPYGWVVAAASLVMMSIGMGATYLAVVGLRPIADEFGWSRQVPSLAYAFAMLGAGVGGMAMGRWADRVGVGWPALLGACMIPFGAWLASRAQSVGMLYLAHGLFIGMLGNGALLAPVIANTTRWFDRRRGLAVAMVASGQHLAGIMWPPVLGWLIAAYGWRSTFVIYAGIAVVLLVPLSLFLRPRPPVPPAGGPVGGPAESGPVVGLHRELVQAMLCLAIVGCCIAMAMPMVHIIAHATDLGHGSTRAAEMLSLLLACGFVSRIGFGLLADRMSGLTALMIGVTGQALVLGLFAVVEGMIGLYVVAAMFGLAFGGIVPCYALGIRELFPASQAGWRIGAIYLFGTLGMAIGGWLGGLIFDLTGTYRTAFLVGVAFNLGTVALVLTLAQRKRAHIAAIA